jgi:D-alanyl-lipoteichoic acid acyltransferase DltB (MBOAT superfamily)
MLFHSGHYIAFLCAVWFLYYQIGRRLRPENALRVQNALLLAASYFFYGYWDWRFLSLILFSTAVDYLSARFIEVNAGSRTKQRLILATSLFLNFGLLGFFKYFGFFGAGLASLLHSMGFKETTLATEIILPLGISFYTFQSVSYTIDVYRGAVAAERNLLRFALYVAFFPQLIAGPIERAKSLLRQIRRPRHFDFRFVPLAFGFFLWGYFKKVFVADSLAPYDLWSIRFHGQHSGADLWLASFAFGFRLYCDYSGYTDMARGSAALFGIKLAKNFRYPLLVTSPSDLWRRWNRTLAFWFRDYVYRPLRALTPALSNSRLWSLICLMLTMALVGAWHGADFKFITWGCLWGLAIAVQYSFGLWRLRPNETPRYPSSLRLLAGWAVTTVLWTWINVLFLAPTLEIGASIQRTMLTTPTVSPRFLRDAQSVFFFILPVIVVDVYSSLAPKWPRAVRLTLTTATWAIFLLILLAHRTNGASEFVYFDF